MLGQKPFRPVGPSAWDVSRRIEDMDRSGVNTQVISATPVFFSYGRPIAAAREFAALVNDEALEMCARSNGRLIALGQVPLQDIESSCAEVDRIKANGMVGVQIGNHVGDKDLDAPDMEAFLTYCAKVDMPVLVHPWDMLGRERMVSHMLPWLVGMPAETQLSVLAMILSGSFERLPRNLRLCFAHGGGSFAFLLGRVENAWHNHEGVREHCPHPPSHYLDRFSVDSAVFDPRAIRLLTDVMGPERVMLGSDYPYPLGEQEVGKLIRETPGYSQGETVSMLGANATEWLGLGNVASQKRARSKEEVQ